MYTVFIVDDESGTRNGLINHFKWDKLNIKVAGEAKDGETALLLLEKVKPDILLTDVKMPGIDGIETARRAQLLLPDIKTVFISGYDDVTYLRSALKMGACDYILKPIEIQELEACMVKLVQRLESEWLDRRKLQDMERRLREDMPLIKERIIADVIQGKIKDKDRSKIDYYGLSAEGKLFTVIVLSPDEGEAASCQGFQDNRQLLNFSIRNIADEAMSIHYLCYIIDDPQSTGQQVALIVSPSESTDSGSLYAMTIEVRDLLKKYLQLNISAGIGSSVADIYETNLSYLSASDALRHRMYLGVGSVTLYNPTILAFSGKIDSNQLNIEDIKELLKRKDTTELENWLNLFFEHLARTRNTDVGFYRKEVSRVLYEANDALNQYISENAESGLSRQEILGQIYSAKSLRQIKETAEKYCLDVYNIIKLKNDNNTIKIISKVKCIINKQFNSVLTINELARDVYLSPTYLCVLFRQEVGMTINNYQTMVRMEKAKKMLDDFSNKLYDISFAVGYSNPSYFSRQFKKYTGMLPSEYRCRGR